jgi:hypothetical protein
MNYFLKDKDRERKSHSGQKECDSQKRGEERND